MKLGLPLMLVFLIVFKAHSIGKCNVPYKQVQNLLLQAYSQLRNYWLQLIRSHN
jgi:hypothetical protein